MGKLTVKGVESARFPDGKTSIEHNIHDGDGLMLRLRRNKSGVSKAWRFPFRLDGQRDAVYIGSFPEIGLADARAKAQECRRLLAQNINPRIHFEREKAVQKAEALTVSRGETPVTVHGLFERWKTDYLSKKHSDGGAYVEGILHRHAFPHLGDLHLQDLNTRHIKLVLDTVHGDKRLKRTCGVILSNLRQMFVWGMTYEWVKRDPTFGLKSDEWDGYGEEGERTFADEEIVELYKKMHSPNCTLGKRWNYTTWLVLGTATRSEETLLAKREHIDLKNSVWMIPKENQKSTRRKTSPRDHFIHLSPFAKSMMEELLKLPGTEEFVFPAEIRAGEDPRPCNKKTHYHALKNRSVGGEPIKGRARDTSSLQLSGGDWTLHDLRRTSSTIMGELEVEPHVIDRCLNHTIPDKIQRTYNKSKLFIPMQEAWNELGDHLANLTERAKKEMQEEKSAALNAAAIAATEGEI